MIDLYIFDQGGALCRHFDIGPSASSALGIDVGKFRELAMPDVHPLMRGEIDSREFRRRFEERSGNGVVGNYWETLFRPRIDEATRDLVPEPGRAATVVGVSPRRPLAKR